MSHRARLQTLIDDLEEARQVAAEQTDDREVRACEIAIARLTAVLDKFPIASARR